MSGVPGKRPATYEDLCAVPSHLVAEIIDGDLVVSPRPASLQHVWLVDPGPQTLEVFRLDAEGWRLLMTAAGASRVRAAPFDAIELDLQDLWAR